jgi:HEAT repeat protein
VALAVRSFDDEVRAAALRALSRLYPYASFQAAVEAALNSTGADVQLAALEAVATFADRSLVPHMAALASSPHARVAEGVARALGTVGRPADEVTLLDLASHADLAVRIAAVKALGAIGTIDAVEPLVPLTQPRIGTVLRDEARAAIRSIQARQLDIAAGRLSAPEGPHDSGALSVAASGPGNLSLVEHGLDAKRR